MKGCTDNSEGKGLKKQTHFAEIWGHFLVCFSVVGRCFCNYDKKNYHIKSRVNGYACMA